MRTRADVAARVELIAAAFRASVSRRARAKRLQPLRAVVPLHCRRVTAVEVDFDRLECGHIVPANAKPYERRCCTVCLEEETRKTG